MKGFDLKIFLPLLLLVGIGLALIYSSTIHPIPPGQAPQFALKQLVWIGIGLILLVATYNIPPRFHLALSYIYYFAVLLLLVFLLARGGGRWIELGPFNLQPSELAKLALILGLARYLSAQRIDLTHLKGFGPPLLLVVLPALIILKEPDLGTALLLLILPLPMLWWAGMDPRNLFFLYSVALSLVSASHWLAWGAFLTLLIVLLIHSSQSLLTKVGILLANLAVGVLTPLIWSHLQGYQRQRVIAFLNPARDPFRAGYQIIQSKIAVGSGGIWGKGFMQGTQAKLSFLPAQHTDFIFSVAGEELGLWGCLLILGLYLILLWGALKIAYRAKNPFSSLVAVGIASVFIIQVGVNVGMTLGMMPITGLPLPFLSYGGSAIIVDMIMVGLLLAINSRWREY